MLIVCTSDAHNRLDLLEKIHHNHPNANLYLDAGDTERHDFEIEPFISVKGNCDRYITNKYRIVEVEGFRIYIFHGDRSLLSLEALAQTAKKNECNFIIHGHTHVPHYSVYNGVHILCPGSIALPRSRDGTTYALITIHGENLDIQFLKVKQCLSKLI